MTTTILTEEQIKKGVDQFGGCPECHGFDEHVTFYQSHMFACHRHKTQWFVGRSQFGFGQNQCERVWRTNCRSVLRYRQVEPWYPSSTFRESAVRWWRSRRVVRVGAELIDLLRRFGRPEDELYHDDRVRFREGDDLPF